VRTQQNNKQAQHAHQLPVRGKIHLPKVKHPTVVGHMTPNENEYQKSIHLKFRYCVGAYIHISLIAFEICHFAHFRPVTLTLTWIGSYGILSCIIHWPVPTDNFVQ